MSSAIEIESNIMKLMDESLNRTSRSITGFLQTHTVIHDTKYSFIDIDFSKYYHDTNEDKIVLLKTEVVGALAGINYLILTKDQIDKLRGNSFIDELEDEDSNQMTVEFLKEIENVLAATTISCFADSFKLDMFGDVPKIQAVASDQIDYTINHEIGGLNSKVLIKSKISMPDLGIEPDLIWFFNGAFVDRVLHMYSKN